MIRHNLQSSRNARRCHFNKIGWSALAAMAFMVTAPSAMRAAAPPQTIFDDSFKSGWTNGSWAVVNVANTAPVHTGKLSISVKGNRGYDALSLRHPLFPADGFKAISFWINGGPAGGQVLRLSAVTGGKAINPTSIPAPPKDAWKKYVVPLSTLGVTKGTKLDAFWISDNTGKALPIFYVDDIQLIAK